VSSPFLLFLPPLRRSVEPASGGMGSTGIDLLEDAQVVCFILSALPDVHRQSRRMERKEGRGARAHHSTLHSPSRFPPILLLPISNGREPMPTILKGQPVWLRCRCMVVTFLIALARALESDLEPDAPSCLLLSTLSLLKRKLTSLGNLFLLHQVIYVENERYV